MKPAVTVARAPADLAGCFGWRALPLLLALGGAMACHVSQSPPETVTPASSAPAGAPSASTDPLGPRPEAPAPASYAPPTPTTFTLPNGMTVWLVERHAVPLVSLSLAVPAGSSADPKGKGGLALQTANMLDEGDGKLGSVDFAAAVDALGARMRTGATFDASYVSLTSLARNFAPAVALVGDAVVHPRLDQAEWKRVHDVWTSNLENRASSAEEVADVVSQMALFGADHPYGHPIEGTVASARAVGLADVRAFYGEAWRPETAIAVVVGDVTRADLEPLLTRSFAGWTAKGPAPAPKPAAAPVPPPHARVVLVDRPDVAQAAIAFIRPGFGAADPEAPLANRANVILGGSFVSRLTQDLREEHGYSYGAQSFVTPLRSGGTIGAVASIITEHTGEAARAMMTDLQTFAATGPTDAETSMSQRLARAELVELFGTNEAAAFRLQHDAVMGLPADYEARASITRDAATKADLARVARDFDPAPGLLVVVGPRGPLEEQLTAAGLHVDEVRDVDGNVVTRPTQAAPHPAKGAGGPPAASSANVTRKAGETR